MGLIYGIQARLDALWHLLRGHRLRWRDNISLWEGCTGDIWCERCPDTSDGISDLSIWCRRWGWIAWCAQILCGWLGHAELLHPYTTNEAGDRVYIEDQWYCYRCIADVEKD